MKKIIGAFIVLLVLVGLFTMTAMNIGWLMAAGLWLGATAVALLLVFGVYLLTS